MPVLSISFWIFTVFGIFVSLATILLCFYILNKFAIELKSWKKLELQLILLRVFCDSINAISGFLYYIASTLTYLRPDVFPFDIPFIIGLVGSTFLEARSFLAAFIAIERVLATFFPLKFSSYRKRISNTPIILFFASTGLASDVALFGFCGFRLPLSPGCLNYACAYPSCYAAYSAASRLIYGSLNGCFSIILCLKLIHIFWNRSKIPKDIKKANLLSLTDGCSTLLFDLFPALIFDSGVVDIKNLGPVVGVLRQTGRAVEAAVMVKLMKKEKVSQLSRVSVSIRNNNNNLNNNLF